MMVNMHAANAKLKKRAAVIVAQIAGCDLEEAQDALASADGDMKLAALLVLGLERGEAERKLARHAGNLRQALADID